MQFKNVKKQKTRIFLFGFCGTSSPEALGEPETHYNFLLDKISSKIDGFAITLLLKILLFILFIKFSRYSASSLVLQLKVRTTSQSSAILVKEFE